MRVLLIEDEPTTAKAIELMLTTEGFNVYSTDLGEEGLDLGKLYDYDIILLDLNLPDMHGYDVLKKLRVAKVQTPVLILSGIAEMDSKIRSFLNVCFKLESLQPSKFRGTFQTGPPDPNILRVA